MSILRTAAPFSGGTVHTILVQSAHRISQRLRFAMLALLLVFIGTSYLVLPAPALAAEQVAITAMEPYTHKNAEGQWSGPAVDLFRTAADRANVQFEFVEQSPGEMAQETRNRTIASFPFSAVAQLAPGDAQSLPFHIDSVGLIGVSASGDFLLGLSDIFNLQFLKIVGLICLLLLIAGAAFWLAEHKGPGALDPETGKIRGIGDGFWWAGVTATTIGYGDLVPKTVSGRVVAMIWMLFSMALTAVLTAYLVSLTKESGGGGDLAQTVQEQRVGIVRGMAIDEQDLDGAKRIVPFDSLAHALRALDQDQVDAVAYPYVPARQQAGGRSILKTSRSVVMPVFRLHDAEKLRTEIDRVILSPAWQARVERQLTADN
ncbi:ion channel [Croceicoccus sp. F390]|uniref:Ion channel n=1 Tax=Croceicoccus esteveae TaxID=3075597 RepID=A0ABU2ZEQ9_9SPHN|nr:ion channel [Croceicoccus sp. F390]MDT0574875.1 ion channel [Croceicoccus sp. F390]